ncbi:uncharacterized protein EDB93DRAFT_1077626 [Suillus bovinus]|uniref:uncharacterized protein n=1 Tax=Suillus bovinus TaxID=48563 RepID=UPI001B87E40B|nr:uncharacterized protein EDB93DRAFT_1077626 [Suillus bovinus]KAG2157996.1 hypothetical protein EDB93DRAFT_1077626 [Suillus bovinus]
MHSESTLNFLGETFNKLSQKLQKFQTFTCAAFDTLELPKEKAACQQRAVQCSETNGLPPESNGARIKKFNLSTYKFHAMGDYMRMIKFFWTTDSFTTQIGELAHRALKVFYLLTSKIDTPVQLAKHKCRCCVLQRVAEVGGTSSSSSQPLADIPPSTTSKQHHYIAPTRNHPVKLFTFLQDHKGDSAVKNFLPKLKDHILYRSRELDISYCNHTFTDEERNSVIIPNNTIYSVQTMQVHYTTYNLRYKYNIINPRTHGDVMVLSGEMMPSHPYWYVRVLGIYHMEVWLNNGSQPVKRNLKVLFVRWLAALRSYKCGMKHTCLPKIAFMEESDPDMFGFLNPGQVIRGAHLIPVFASGHGVSSLQHGTLLARPGGELDDWEEYYVGIFVGRDMFMRYTQFGVGHQAMLRKIIRDCLSSESMV